MKQIRTTKGGNYIHINTGAKLFYYEHCKKCGEPYLAQKKNKGYCSRHCSYFDNEKLVNNIGINNSFYGKKHSVATKKKISISRAGKGTKEKNHNYNGGHWKGNKNPNWKGGVYFSFYGEDWTEDLKKFIRNRDNNRCQFPECEHKNFVQCVHHIDGNKLNCQPSNLITLCKKCHQKIHVSSKKEEYDNMLKEQIIKLMDGDLTAKEMQS